MSFEFYPKALKKVTLQSVKDVGCWTIDSILKQKCEAFCKATKNAIKPQTHLVIHLVLH